MNIPENPLPSCPDSPNCYRITEVFEGDSTEVYQAFEKSIHSEGPFNIETDITGENLTISATYKIPVFDWLDDVKIILESTSKNKKFTFVHLKSASRDGYYDLGVNKRRINRILEKARKELNH